ncbi:carbohydrate sulfotransferase 11-like [Dermacentor albipictus]|uniref:carbohydrate sulfotransferase 11-like n=1 Tax=Dermacentor albipictus TaxID=60249 RepID=UPI0038FCD32A
MGAHTFSVEGNIDSAEAVSSKGDDMAARVARLDSVCKKYAESFEDDTHDNRTNSDHSNCTVAVCCLHLMTKHNFSFCTVPKAASTSLRTLYLQVEYGKNPVDNPEATFVDFEHRTRAVFPSAYWRDRLGSSYTKLVIVRHPFERLVSAYVHRVRTTMPSTEGATRMYRRGFVGHGPNGTFTFREFVENILQDPVSDWDVHWAPYTTRCRPCSVRYNMIVKVETLDKDMEHVLPHIGLTGWKFPIRNVHSPTQERAAQESFRRHFSELSRQQVLQLYAIYVYDFELFGYRLQGYSSPVM